MPARNPRCSATSAKAYLTDSMRQVVADAMDIRAGSAIQRGPRNTLARAWDAVPIGITVEGANILTRSMIIYGQGAIRCHPFVQKEINAVAAQRSRRVRQGDLRARQSFRYARDPRQAARAGRIAARGAAACAGYARYYQHLSRFLRRVHDHFRHRDGYARWLAQAARKTFGPTRRCTRVSVSRSRRAEALSRRSQEHASNFELARWSVELCLYRVQEALVGVLDNLPMRWVAVLLRLAIFPLGVRFRPPSDGSAQRVARAILEDREARQTLTGDMFVPPASRTRSRCTRSRTRQGGARDSDRNQAARRRARRQARSRAGLHARRSRPRRGRDLEGGIRSAQRRTRRARRGRRRSMRSSRRCIATCIERQDFRFARRISTTLASSDATQALSRLRERVG